MLPWVNLGSFPTSFSLFKTRLWPKRGLSRKMFETRVDIGHAMYTQMEDYRALKEEIVPFAATWMKLVDGRLSARSQREGHVVHSFPWVRNLK